MLVFNCTEWNKLISLTPSNDGYDDDMFGMDVPEYDDEFLKHEQGLGSHPGHRRHGEVLDEQREGGAANLSLRAVDSNQKEEQHAENGNAQLNVELASLLCAYFPINSMDKFGHSDGYYIRLVFKHTLSYPSLAVNIRTCTIIITISVSSLLDLTQPAELP